VKYLSKTIVSDILEGQNVVISRTHY